MELTGRLRAIAEMVPQTNTAADIGCDHGKLAVWLVQNDRAQRVICGDISIKSLEKARRLADIEGLGTRIETRVGDGLGILAAGEADVAVIAGMGGELIVSILDANRNKAPDTLVLSCHTSAEVLRAWLGLNGFRFDDEALVEEKGHFYPVMRLVRGQGACLSWAECEFGPVLLQKKPMALRRLVEKRIRTTRSIIKRIEHAAPAHRRSLRAQTEEMLERYEEVLKCL